jgi:maleylpyruvate isomerase
VWARSAGEGWPHRHLLAGDHWTTPESPWRRLREIEVHHVDLGIGYLPEDWSEEYVRWELPRLLASLPDRIRDPHDAGRMIAWLIGRAGQPGPVRFEPWG